MLTHIIVKRQECQKVVLKNIREKNTERKKKKRERTE